MPTSSSDKRERTATRIVALIAALIVICLCVCGIATCAQMTSGDVGDTVLHSAVEAVEPDPDMSNLPQTLSTQNPDVLILDVVPIAQLPELPGGCEITSATIMLDYYGFDCDKEELDSFLPQTYDYDADPSEFFIGHTDDETGWYCEPGPVVVAVNDYLADKLTSHYAKDITGTVPEELYTQVASGNPICVWVSTYMQDREVLYTWTSDLGNECEASVQDHCMVLCGFDRNEDIVFLADPLDADEIVAYDREDFEESYTSRGSMACMMAVF